VSRGLGKTVKGCELLYGLGFWEEGYETYRGGGKRVELWVWSGGIIGLGERGHFANNQGRGKSVITSAVGERGGKRSGGNLSSAQGAEQSAY